MIYCFYKELAFEKVQERKMTKKQVKRVQPDLNKQFTEFNYT